MLFDGRNYFTTLLYLINNNSTLSQLFIDVYNTTNVLLRTISLAFPGDLNADSAVARFSPGDDLNSGPPCFSWAKHTRSSCYGDWPSDQSDEQCYALTHFSAGALV
jgi:hypothetical protein